MVKDAVTKLSTYNTIKHFTPLRVGPTTPVTPATCTTPVTPVMQKGRGKGKGKSSTPKTPSVVTPNPNDYGPLVLDAIEKALLETKAPNIIIYVMSDKAASFSCELT